MDKLYLPLYSNRGEFNVPNKSGLNQWNADGRPRNINEVYIPIPKSIHRNFPDFFPDRNKRFSLILPDGSHLSAKVCQGGEKALMTDPNSDLGEWILRDELEIEEGVLVTYEMLEDIGIDSVRILKESNTVFHIDIAEFGAYERQNLR